MDLKTTIFNGLKDLFTTVLKECKKRIDFIAYPLAMYTAVQIARSWLIPPVYGFYRGFLRPNKNLTKRYNG
jgi:hypothetical protein